MTTYFLAALLAGATGLGSDRAASPNNEALERAARDYRIQVYETFHLDRPEYDRRRGEWEQIEQSWRNAGSPAAEQAKLVQWLKNATAQSGTDGVGPLPKALQFVALPKQPKSTDADPFGQTAKPSKDAPRAKLPNQTEAKPVSDRNPAKTTGQQLNPPTSPPATTPKSVTPSGKTK